MGVLVAFEAVFAYLRQLLILHLTTRVDVKLATYMFDKILNLPIDFFERTQVGRITYDVQQIWRIRTFLIGQMFGTVLDFATLLVFLPIMFFFSPIMTVDRPGVLRTDGVVDRRDAAVLPREIERGGERRVGARRVSLFRPSTASAPSNRWRSTRGSVTIGTCIPPGSPNCASPRG